MTGSVAYGQVNEESTVVYFPLARQVKRIDAVASLVARLTDVDIADFCRHRIADDLFRELSDLGVPEAEQDEAVGAFFAAVEAEILRRHWQDFEAAL